MRRAIITAFLTVFASSFAARASASPELQVDMRRNRIGDVYVVNDVPGSIINIKSLSGILKAPTFPDGPIPAPMIVDDGDLPFYLAFLNMPAGRYRVGSHMLALPVNPSPSAILDITMEWYPSFGQPATVGATVLLYPEPSSGLMAALSVLSFVGARRRLGRSATSPR